MMNRVHPPHRQSIHRAILMHEYSLSPIVEHQPRREFPRLEYGHRSIAGDWMILNVLIIRSSATIRVMAAEIRNVRVYTNETVVYEVKESSDVEVNRFRWARERGGEMVAYLDDKKLFEVAVERVKKSENTFDMKIHSYPDAIPPKKRVVSRKSTKGGEEGENADAPIQVDPPKPKKKQPAPVAKESTPVTDPKSASTAGVKKRPRDENGQASESSQKAAKKPRIEQSNSPAAKKPAAQKKPAASAPPPSSMDDLFDG